MDNYGSPANCSPIRENHVLGSYTPMILTTEKKTKLTRREKEILKTLASGVSNQDIAAKLCIRSAYPQNPCL
jgi:DNA-binding NarL/FixJ family response regulator